MQVVSEDGSAQTLGALTILRVGITDSTAVYTRVVSYATDRAIAKSLSSAGNANYHIITISGTTPTRGASIGATVNTYGHLIYDAGDNAVYEMGDDGIYKFTYTDSSISRTKIVGNINLNVVNDFTVGAYSTDNSYFLNMGTFHVANAFATYNIKGMSDNLLGIVQATTSRGNSVPVLIKGIDANQSGLIPGSSYTISNGALTLVATDAVVNSVNDVFLVKSMSTTEVLI